MSYYNRPPTAAEQQDWSSMPPDFTEDQIARDMAKVLDVEVDDIIVEDAMISSFGGEAYSITYAGGGYSEWTVVEDEDTAYNLALAAVTQDLEQEPEIFNPSFIESHIDMDALKQWVYEAGLEDSYAEDIARYEPERFWDEAESWGIDMPEEDEDGEYPEDVGQEYIDALQEAIARDRSEDPMSFFEDIYGDEATARAIEAVGIDVEEAAKDALRQDGWSHFLARYDGNYNETPSGFIYWRDN